MRIAIEPMAAQPVAPTTAAMAPNAPIGAAHMIIIIKRKTTAWMCLMPLSTGSPLLPMDCSAKPTSNASTRVGSTGMSPGIMSSRKATVEFSSPLAPDSYGSSCSPEPGWMMLPTTRPMASAKVDMVMKYSSARPPTLPTVAALAIEPTPSTMVQKMTGAISILISATNPVPSGLSALPRSGANRPTAAPSTTAAITMMYSQWVLSFFFVPACGELPAGVIWSVTAIAWSYPRVRVEPDGAPLRGRHYVESFCIHGAAQSDPHLHCVHIGHAVGLPGATSMRRCAQ